MSSQRRRAPPRRKVDLSMYSSNNKSGGSQVTARAPSSTARRTHYAGTVSRMTKILDKAERQRFRRESQEEEVLGVTPSLEMSGQDYDKLVVALKKYHDKRQRRDDTRIATMLKEHVSLFFPKRITMKALTELVRHATFEKFSKTAKNPLVCRETLNMDKFYIIMKGSVCNMKGAQMDDPISPLTETNFFCEQAMWQEEQFHPSSWKAMDDCEFCVFERKEATIRFFEETVRPALNKERLMNMYFKLPAATSTTRRFGMTKLESRMRAIVYTIRFIIKLDKMAHGTARVVKPNWADEWSGGMHEEKHTQHIKHDDEKLKHHQSLSTLRRKAWWALQKKEGLRTEEDRSSLLGMSKIFSVSGPEESHLPQDIFSVATKELIKVLNANARPIKYVQGTTIYKKGDMVEDMFVVLNGKVKTTWTTPVVVEGKVTGEEAHEREIKVGGSFGETAHDLREDLGRAVRTESATVEAEGVEPVFAAVISLKAYSKCMDRVKAMIMARRVRVLSQIGFLQGWNKPKVVRLAHLVEEAMLPPCTPIVRQGDRADAIYFLLFGEAKAEMPPTMKQLRRQSQQTLPAVPGASKGASDRGKGAAPVSTKKFVHVLQSPDVFGHFAVAIDAPIQPVTVTSTTEVIVLTCKKAVFDEHIRGWEGCCDILISISEDRMTQLRERQTQASAAPKLPTKVVLHDVLPSMEATAEQKGEELDYLGDEKQLTAKLASPRAARVLTKASTPGSVKTMPYVRQALRKADRVLSTGD